MTRMIRLMDATGWLLDTSNPEDVARANFPIVRRGFDPIEVQGFARSVSAEITRLRHQCTELEKALATAEGKASERLTEATVAGFLGDQASKMLQASREAAETAVARANETAARTVTEADEYAARTVSDADGHADRVGRQARVASERMRREAEDRSNRARREADEYAGATRTQADEYSVSTRTQADADAELTRRQADVECDRLIQDAMDHRTAILRELVRRRDLASNQIRSLMAGRDLVVEALGQVGALVAGVTEGLQDIGTAPSDFVQLDPDVEGVASEANAVVAVTRSSKTGGRAKPHVRETAALAAG
jgi:cell division septum initiation protein DivIVA